MDALKNAGDGPHSSHPDFGHLCLLVFEAVLEVCVVAAPGYILARQGGFSAEQQSYLSKINIAVFTPCLIFSKLASQLTAEKLIELAVIPFIFAVQTFVSWACSQIVARLIFKFEKRPRNFVTAMAVFGNSNSLPISLVISLSKTLSGLHWDKIPGDNDNEVAARGILYLLIFQQLGQVVRWSWGYNVLLAPPKNDHETPPPGSYRDEDSDAASGRLVEFSSDDESDIEQGKAHKHANGNGMAPNGGHTVSTSVSNSGTLTPGDMSPTVIRGAALGTDPSPNGNLGPHLSGQHEDPEDTVTFRRHYNEQYQQEEFSSGPAGWWQRFRAAVCKCWNRVALFIKSIAEKLFSSLPKPVQKFLSAFNRYFSIVWNKFLDVMNPPLWAMLSAIIVASVPGLQHLFYTKGTFINNSVSHAIGQSGGVAVPLILFVLGGNLARNTLPKASDQAIDTEDPKEERNVLIAALVSRMLLPTIFMAPLLALTAKYVPVSILDDPIFVIVCFLLTGAPSALQLAQICQVNGVYMGAMSRLLFQSYVVWILPSTLILVMLALETVEWATGQY
ncbi:auxin efflux carrier [Rhizodiscina lignyota]|uniref:Auxin efflux carrier n=1 Tax=Rhizodiscina lignyota TaxID=1504668 RepID=A0A9P4I3P5_9PEZI|nr:auxin efflux carrier [Rhizodiscina lignyota]